MMASMSRTLVLELVEFLQHRFVSRLEALDQPFQSIRWLRDDGRHGGGVRYGTGDTPVFNRASVNVSSIHYDDRPDKALESATALSTIVHPANPRAPSVHLHLSWTATRVATGPDRARSGTGYWRMMADLNPSHEDQAETERFAAAVRQAAGSRYDEGREQGDRYFFIPALGRHRGATHFYLEAYDTGDFAADLALARAIGQAGIDTYTDLLADALRVHPSASDEERSRQLTYHTVYLFQVLTLDRGTTSGLLVHDQNDVGILGSLPGRVDRDLLASWIDRMPPPQDELLRAIVDTLPATGVVETAEKQRLAAVVRAHYRAHPAALDLQASGHVIPPTVQNHR